MRQRSKPRLFSFAREVEMAHFDDMLGDPVERIALEGLVDAFIAICQTRSLDPITLAPVEAAAQHSSAAVRGLGITRLTVLTHYFEEATDALVRVCRSADPEVRLFATAALANTPERVGAPLLEYALVDAAWEVRKAAGNVASAVAWSSLIPVLEHAIAKEHDARVKVALGFALEFQARAAATVE